MREDIKNCFLKAIDLRSRGKSELTSAVTEELSARREFENAFETVILTIIKPALNEIAHDLLRPAGWICSVSRAIEGEGIIFTIYRPDMDGRMNTRPSVSFHADRTRSQVWVQCSVRSESQSTGILKLNEITNDIIQEKVLEFFRELG